MTHISATDNVLDATNLIKYPKGAVKITKIYAQNHLLINFCERVSSPNNLFSIHYNLINYFNLSLFNSQEIA
jgi:hypothetical protein